MSFFTDCRDVKTWETLYTRVSTCAVIRCVAFIDLTRKNISHNHTLFMYTYKYLLQKLIRSLLCLVLQGEEGFDGLKVDQFHRHKSLSAF